MFVTVFITTLLLLVLVYLAYHCYALYGRNGRLINNIPGPSGYPIIGNILQLQGSTKDLWNLLITLSDQYYPYFKIWALITPVVSIRHPDDLEIILKNTKYIEKSRIYNILQPWLNTGLLTSGGSKWHLRRKILTPAFHFNILQQFVEILIEEGESMTKSLKKMGDSVVKDLVPFVSEHTLNAICETAMGISPQGIESSQYRDAVYQIGQIAIYRFMRPWLYYNWIFSLTPKSREQRKILKILHGFTEKVIAERKSYHKQSKGQYLKNLNKDVVTEIGDEEIIGSKKKRLAMLDLLIVASLEGLLTDLDIREEIDTFMFEGHDTTATGICFALSLLAEHKDIQNRVREEINSVMQESRGKFTMKALQDLHYLERCIKEVLRLYPSVFFISRLPLEDVQLSLNNVQRQLNKDSVFQPLRSYLRAVAINIVEIIKERTMYILSELNNRVLIPPKTILHLNIYGVHRDPNFWPNPEVFDPDRFLPEAIRNRHPYSYIPFSAGPRNCIGQRFALLEMKALISQLIYNFYLEPVDYLKDITLKVDLVIRPAHPVRIKFIPIAKKSKI